MEDNTRNIRKCVAKCGFSLKNSGVYIAAENLMHTHFETQSAFIG